MAIAKKADSIKRGWVTSFGGSVTLRKGIASIVMSTHLPITNQNFRLIGTGTVAVGDISNSDVSAPALKLYYIRRPVPKSTKDYEEANALVLPIIQEKLKAEEIKQIVRADLGAKNVMGAVALDAKWKTETNFLLANQTSRKFRSLDCKNSARIQSICSIRRNDVAASK